MLAALARVNERRAQLHPLLRAIKGFMGFLTRPGPRFGVAWKWAAAMVAVLLVAASGWTLAASASSLPGDALYPLKVAGQRAHLALTFDADSQRLLADRLDAQRRSDIEEVLGTGRQVSVEFRGILERMEGAIWIVGGLPVTVDEATIFVGRPHPGVLLRVRGELPGDGALLAVQVEVVSDATPLPTPSSQPTGTPLPTATPTATGTPQPTGTVEATEGVETDEATGSGEGHETPLPALTASPQPEDSEDADGATETPAVQEPGHTPEVQETPDSIANPQPEESPEPQDTPAAIEEPEPEETPEAEDTPESIEDPDSDEQPEPEDTPESVEDPDSDEQLESDSTPEVPGMSEPGRTGESAVAPQQDGSPHREQIPESLCALLVMTINTSDREVTLDNSHI